MTAPTEHQPLTYDHRADMLAAAAEHGWSLTPRHRIEHPMRNDERLLQWERSEPNAITRYLRVMWNAGGHLTGLQKTFIQQHGVVVRGHHVHGYAEGALAVLRTPAPLA